MTVWQAFGDPQELQLEIRKGYCPDCNSAYVLSRCMVIDRLVPTDERARCLEASP